MHKLSNWQFCASLMQIGISFMFGVLSLHNKVTLNYDWPWRQLTPRIVFMIFGWTMPFMMGIVYRNFTRLRSDQCYTEVYLRMRVSFYLIAVS